jgi:hypothetical protein
MTKKERKKNRRLSKAKYQASPKGKVSQAKYRASSKGKVAQAKYKETTEGKIYYEEYYPKYRANPDRKLQLKINRLKLKYDMTLEDYDKMFVEQGGLCAISGLPLSDPNIDHDHTTGRVRGLLGREINRALGMFQDNPIWLRAAADYIEKNL